MNHCLKSFSLVALLLMGVYLSGCSQSKPAKTDSKSSDTTKKVDMDSFGLEPLEPAREARDEPLGEKTLTGKLMSTKGNQATVNGVILSRSYVFDEHRRWKPELMALKNKRVTVTGEVIRHWCGPYEQCLEQGYIDRMVEITELSAK
jgi:hypothetical protein